MAAGSAKFERLDSDKEPFAAEDSEVEVVAGTNGNNHQMDLSQGQGRFFAIKRRHMIVGVIVVVIAVLVLLVVSSVVGHYSGKSKSKAHSSSQSGLQMKWSEWSDWDPCSVTCGKGMQRRRRTCMFNGTHTCIGKDDDITLCAMEDCNDDMWLNWSEWGPCQNVSGTCQKSRSRSCHNTALQIAGGRCTGDRVQDSKCKQDACHVTIWADWQDWTSCSSNCDFGAKTRERLCKDNTGQTINTTQCVGQEHEKEWCHIIDCKDLDECLSNPCVRGTCVDKLKEYECICEDGWHGVNCEVVDTCASNPCVYGTCTNHDNGFNCTCKGALGPMCEIPMSDCLDIKESGQTVTGVYTIRLKTTNETIDVLCDMDAQDGGWIVFQNRFNGSVDFYRNFSEYKNGFGDPNGEHWLGLRYIYELTRGPTQLNVVLIDASDNRAYHLFRTFTVSADPNFELDISGPSGNAGTSSTGILYNDGFKFSTFDRDVSGSNCAVKDYGGWWFSNCAYANLNGYYAVPGSTTGYKGRPEAAMTYRSYKKYESLKGSRMMLRRV